MCHTRETRRSSYVTLRLSYLAYSTVQYSLDRDNRALYFTPRSNRVPDFIII